MTADLTATHPVSWMTRTVRKLHLDWHQPAWMPLVGAALAPKEAARQAQTIRRAHVQAVEVFFHDHHGYGLYPTHVGRPHPHLTGDPAGTLTAALKAEGLRVIAYLNVFTSVWLGREHPDWLVTSPDGTFPQAAWLTTPGSAICASSPYLDEYFLPLLLEVLERYDVDALWLDGASWLMSSLCHCRYCRARYDEDTGRPLPQRVPEVPEGALADDFDGEDDAWFTWLTWRRAQVAAYLARVRAVARAAKPDVLIADNCVGKVDAVVPVREDGKVRWLRTRELAVDWLSCDPVPFGGSHAVVLSREGRVQATSGLPFDFMNERFHKWGEWQLRSATDHRLEFATVLAQGGLCFFADQPYQDGRLEDAALAQLSENYAWVEARESFFHPSAPVYDVAVLAAPASQLFGPLGSGLHAARPTFGPLGSTPTLAARTDRIDGAHLACLAAGVHHLIYDEATLCDALDRLTAVIIPEQVLVEDRTLDALRRFVERGGGLLVTGRTGERDEQYRPRDCAQLHDLLGVRLHGPDPAPLSYLRFTADARQAAALPDVPWQCWGTALVAQPTTAQVLAWRFPPLADVWRDGVRDHAHWQHHTTLGACPPAQEPDGAGITLHRLGAGRVVYMAVDPFAAYRHEGHHLARRALTYLLDLVAPPDHRLVATRKPLHVEVSVRRQGERLVVHLLNHNQQKTFGRLAHVEEVTPVHDLFLDVRFGRPAQRVTLEPGGMPLTWTNHRGRVHITVPCLELHAAVVIE